MESDVLMSNARVDLNRYFHSSTQNACLWLNGTYTWCSKNPVWTRACSRSRGEDCDAVHRWPRNADMSYVIGSSAQGRWIRETDAASRRGKHGCCATNDKNSLKAIKSISPLFRSLRTVRLNFDTSFAKGCYF